MRPKAVISLGILTDGIKDARELHNLAGLLQDAMDKALEGTPWADWATVWDYRLTASSPKAMANNFKKRGIQVVEKEEK
jgi:hypothetical protein